MVLLMVESGFAESGHSIVKKWIVMLAISLSWGMVSIAWAVQPTKQILNQQLRQIVNHERLTYQLPALSVAIQLPMETTPRDYVSGYLTVKEKYHKNLYIGLWINHSYFINDAHLKKIEQFH
ncbi:MAG: hypothetical protein GY782_09080 [Gammaproteobacteria bacterium]|nr:hypothetical protein [Gammaproteobacteria bacterium]